MSVSRSLNGVMEVLKEESNRAKIIKD